MNKERNKNQQKEAPFIKKIPRTNLPVAELFSADISIIILRNYTLKRGNY
jgi:hypothetical protein